MASAYIETSIPSYYVSRPSQNPVDAARQILTIQWWDSGANDLELFTSEETWLEAQRGDPKLAEERCSLLQPLPWLPYSNDVANLANMFLQKGVLPAKAASDAIHIALATIHHVDYLVTWNFKHIANPFIQKKLQQIIRDADLPIPVLCSPEHLLIQNEY
jgi:predicted nucleic acid-binding protein